jgi:hypothetical protein
MTLFLIPSSDDEHINKFSRNTRRLKKGVFLQTFFHVNFMQLFATLGFLIMSFFNRGYYILSLFYIIYKKKYLI